MTLLCRDMNLTVRGPRDGEKKIRRGGVGVPIPGGTPALPLMGMLDAERPCSRRKLQPGFEENFPMKDSLKLVRSHKGL